MKKCTRCGEERPIDQFYKDSRYRGGLWCYCKSCASSVNKINGKNRDKTKKAASSRASHLRNAYGISDSQYNEMRGDQAYRCYICDEHEDTATFGKLVVDHDHITGMVRRLLCNSCNTALGLARENPKILSRLSAYIKEYTPIGT